MLQWCLLELCKQPDIQQKLREELLQFSPEDPTWDQFMNSLPYLDAVVHETLRLHPPLGETTRVVCRSARRMPPLTRTQAAEDDVIPLSTPVRATNGQLVDSVAVTKGQLVTVPIHMMNKSVRFWGADAKEFKPARWLAEDGIPQRAREIQGHKHLLTFVDGPRTCLGRHFALAEFKVCRSPRILRVAG